jgi:superfamily I DNA/RNA helicase
METAEQLDQIGPRDACNEWRIFGPPGTGKTTYTAKQVERAAAKYGADQILVTSFSRAAAAELVARDLPVNRENVGTLHALCYRALDKPPLAEAKSHIADWNAQYPHWGITGVTDTSLDEPLEPLTEDASGDDLLAEVNRWRNRKTRIELWPQRLELHNFFRTFTAWKDESGLLDFTDLLEHAERDCRVAPGNPQVLFADEAQDFTRLQLSIVRRWGSYAEYYIVVGDDDQCSPAWTMVRTTSGDVPIECLDPEKHRVVAYSRSEGAIVGARNGFGFRKAARPYKGDLIGVSAGGQTTFCTPDHKWLTKWNDGPELRAAHVVYLMQRGGWWRVGWCRLMRADNCFHLGVRARLENADSAWILKVFPDRQQASLYESIVATRYGLPLVTFEPLANTLYTRDGIDRVFTALDPTEQWARAQTCLQDHGRLPQCPIYLRDCVSRAGNRITKMAAANMLPGLTSVPVPREGKRVTWEPIETRRVPHDGLVYSLDVDKHHTFISDGLVTHNCIYSFIGCTPDAMLRPDVPAGQKIVLSQSYRVPSATHALAMRWIEHVTAREPKVYRPTSERGAITLFELGRYDPACFQHPERIVDLAEREIEEGRTVMLLASCSYMLQPLRGELVRRGLPFHNPYRRKRGDWNPLWSAHGTTATERLLAFIKPHLSRGNLAQPYTAGDYKKWADWLLAERTFSLGGKTGAKAMQDGETIDLGLLQQWLKPEAYDGLINNIMNRPLDEHLRWWLDRVLQSHAKTAAYPVQIATQRGVEALLEKPKIIIGTIHSVKGGEADTVFLFPDLSNAGYLEWTSYPEGRDSLYRLFYVGITRARHKLVICAAASDKAVSL